MNYFQVKNGQFTRDVELNFSYEQAKYPDIFNWRRYVDHLQSNEQVLVDISQIPPSIFLLAIVNGTSTGFGLFIPLDMSHHEFFKRLVRQFSEGYLAAIKRGSNTILSPERFGDLDLDHIDRTGSICCQANAPIRGIVQAAQDFWQSV